MDPSSSVPLHFSLEFFGLAVSGGLLAWAAQARKRVAFPLLALIAAQVLHVMSVSGSWPGWIAATASLAVAGAGSRFANPAIWIAGWAAVVPAAIALAATDPHTGQDRITSDLLWIHGLQFAGYAVLSVWAWKQAMSSVRLRLLGTIAAALVVVVVVAGGSVIRVVAVDLENEELDRLGVQASNQSVALGGILDDLARRSAIVSAAFSRDILSGGRLEETARLFSTDVFTDLTQRGFVAFVQPTSVVGAGVEGIAEGLVSAPEVVQAIAGTGAAGYSLAGADLLLVGASPVYRSPQQTPENVVGAAVIGRRVGEAEMQQAFELSKPRDADPGRHAAILAPDGRVASKNKELGIESVPPAAAVAVERKESWQGLIETTDQRLLAVAVPLIVRDRTQAAILRSAGDDALVATTNEVARALTGAVLAAALIAILIGMWFGSRLARPIIALTSTARRVEQGDLEATSDVRSTDEVGVLATAFDGMTASLRDTIAAEQETRRQLEAVVGGMGEGLAAVDEDFNIVTFNPAAEAITGVSADDAIGRKCHEVYGELTSGKEGKPICDYMCPIRHGGGKDGSVEIRSVDGRKLTLAVTSSTLRDDQGNVIGGVDLLRDVTPEMQAERMKSTIISRTAHELRTPLVPIKGYAQIMLRKEVSRKDAIAYLNEINAGADRLERNVKILVDIAEMEAGRLQARTEETRPEAIVRQAADRWRERRIGNIRASAAKGLPAVAADVSLIGRAMDELIANAVEYSPDGAQIELTAKKVQGGVEFSVRDRGKGIPPGEVETIFDEFAQADADNPVRGLGVGLSFVRGVVEAHRGDIRVVSKPKRGSTFSFVLPVAGKPGRRR